MPLSTAWRVLAVNYGHYFLTFSPLSCLSGALDDGSTSSS
jgi:hypothetical protein